MASVACSTSEDWCAEICVQRRMLLCKDNVPLQGNTFDTKIVEQAWKVGLLLVYCNLYKYNIIVYL